MKKASQHIIIRSLLSSSLLITIWFSTLCVPFSAAEAFKLPDTGQKKCFDTTGIRIPCTGTGQDGAYHINPLSYTDNVDGTVTDNNTGLIWQQQVEDAKMSWSEADGYCSSLTLGGYEDWKLPSKTKLASIINYAIPSPAPAIDPVFMPIADQHFGYWTSTPHAAYLGGAWTVFFPGGAVTADYGLPGYVRCVRDAQYPVQTLVDNGNGTVSDTRTGLMWQQGEPGGMSWNSALAYCEGLYLGGHADWRLPNNKEFESITDSARWGPAINTAYFPDTYADYYWSSTTLAEYPYAAWLVDFVYGGIEVATLKENPAYVRCVRGNLPNILHVTKSGTGSGTVTSTPAGITCGTDCNEEYGLGQVVTLTAVADFGSFFSGWSGDPDCANGTIVSDGPKTCIATFSSTLRVLSPANGEIVSAGSLCNITWAVLDEAVRFKLFYSIDNKLTWVPITKTASGTSYPWTVPALLKNKKAHLKIIGFTADDVKAGTGISDGNFVIEAVSILSPNSGSQHLISGTPVDITWRTTPTPKTQVASHSVFYTTNGGLTWKLIGSGNGNPGTYSWTPLVVNKKTKCKVKVVLKDDAGNKVGTAVSDGYFSINLTP